MINEKYSDLVIAYLDDTISADQRERLNELIDKGKIDILDIKEMEQLYQSLGDLPAAEPSQQVRKRFDTMLETEKKRQNRMQNSPIFDVVKRFFTLQRAGYTALAVCLLFIGMLIGNLFMPFQDYRSQMNHLSNEVSQMKKVMAMSLLDAPSSTARLKAVNISSEIVSPNKRIIKALFKTLNNDPNVNVRLASIDALLNHAKNPKVRSGLIQSIAKQESPQLQVALANAMLALQETDSIDELQQLLEKNDLQPIVRQKLNTTIAMLKQ